MKVLPEFKNKVRESEDKKMTFIVHECIGSLREEGR